MQATQQTQQKSCSLHDDVWTGNLVQYIDIYKSLIDSYIVEFFTECHWDKLPALWRETLNQISLHEFCNQLCKVQSPHSFQSNQSPLPKTIILPLSLLAFSATADTLSFPLYPSPSPLSSSFSSVGATTDSQVMELKHLFRRHVKLKKQHEIKQLTKVIQGVCNESQTHNVIDLGCGQGHLARCLAYHYGCNVTAVEAIGCHLESAMQYDRQVTADIERELKAKNQEIKTGSIRYVEQLIEPTVSLKALGTTVMLTSDKHVLVGLHSCGDLSTTLLRLFSESESAVGLISVGCCYMKLSEGNSTGVTSSIGYPMSEILRDHSLSYEARELACHSKEVYIKRLTEGSEHIKIHCWRAAVETILREKHGLKRPHIKIPSSVSKLPFKEYANVVLQSLGLTLTQEDMESMLQLIDKWWERVVMYFLLRLKMAPCIETLILMDRSLFLQEKGIKCQIQPLFDPLLSPRNLVLTAVK